MRSSLTISTPAEPSPDSASASVAMVALDGVSLRFGGVRALDEVSLDVAAGEIVSLLGPSGSGKSSLLRIVAGIERPTAGRVAMEGIEVAGPRRFVEPEHRRVGMVFQDYALFPHLTVAGNVAFGLKGRYRSDVVQTVGGLLERLGLARYSASYPHALSGGERQRVALARALAPAPRVLLMDEPFSGLDDRLRERVRGETIALLREARTTTIVVTHDPNEAVRIADRIALLENGRLLQCGSAEELYTRPTTVFAARLFSEINELTGTCRRGQVDTPLGSFAAPHLSEETNVRVCIRPQHLRVSAEPTHIHGRVLAAEFLGDVDHLVIEVPGLHTPVSLRTVGRARVTPGEVIYLDVDVPRAIIVSSHD